MTDLSLDPWLGTPEKNTDYLDRDTLIKLMEQRVSQLLDTEPDLLWSFLYRLDIDEHKIRSAIDSQASVANVLANLIVDRQLERMATKRKYKSTDLMDEDLKL